MKPESSDQGTGDTGDAPRVLRAPLADLERALIEAFLQGRGVDAEALAALSPAAHDALLAEASVFASAKLAEIEARSQYLHEIHE